MSPETADLIKTVSLEAIKILGPAIVAACAAYKGASIQMAMKLRELEKSHQFSAREKIFSHLKERLVVIDEQTEKLSNDLAKMLSFVAGFQEGSDSSPMSDRVVQLMTESAQVTAKLAPLEVAALLNVMRASGLEGSEEFKALVAHQVPNWKLSNTSSDQELRALVLGLLDTYNLLGLCTRLLLQKQLERVFTPYMASSK